MRKFKRICFAVLVILFAILCAVFYEQNPTFFEPETELKLDLYFIPPLESVPIKFSILVLVSFFLGAFTVGFYSYIKNFRLKRTIKKQNKDIARLEEEINSLRGLPATGSTIDIEK
jgi:putative membrane protein